MTYHHLAVISVEITPFAFIIVLVEYILPVIDVLVHGIYILHGIYI